MPDGTLAILLLFAVSVTPSVSDAVQLHLASDGRFDAVIVGWWVILFCLIATYWRTLK